MSCRVRLAISSDIAAMHDIRLAVRENRLSEGSGITPASYGPYVNSGSAWVAERDGQVVGFAAADAATGSVWTLFVAPAAEGTGAGRALHEALLGWAAARKMERITLETAAGTRAEGFYRAMGWRATGSDEKGQIRFERSAVR